MNELLKPIRLAFFGKSLKAQKKVIYTALFNGYDTLCEPKYVTPGWDYVCFTDDAKLSSNTWKCIFIEPNTENGFLNNRKLKILYKDHLNKYDLSIYIDANMVIKRNLNRFCIDKLKDGAVMSLPHHKVRRCIYDEAEACIEQHKDSPEKIRQQMANYQNEGYPTNFGLSANRLIIRKHDADTEAFMTLWWKELTKFSRRDQLCLFYCFWKYNFRRYHLFDYYELKKYFEINKHC